ncbi:MAG: GAF domain-containing sensor histidine kinase [Ardenticatenaceae bacterium]|nr:GAF domain-containing sensor histidine kinase [Ardenticatenaceae bacterium]
MDRSQSFSISPETLTRIIEVGRKLNSTTDMNDLLQQIIHEAAELLNSEGISVLLFDQATRELRFKAIVGEASEQLLNKAVPLKGSIAGSIFLENAPKIIDDVRQTESWNPDYDADIDFKTDSILGVPLHDGSGEPVGVIEAINKVSDRFNNVDIAVLSTFADLAGVAITKAQLFEELQEAYDQLNELDQRKSDFIALASHELRTPLSVILGYVSYLREQAQGDQAEQLDMTLKAAIQLRNLIQDMVNLRYVESGELNPDAEEFNLSDLIRTIMNDREELAVAKNLTFKLHLPNPQLMILADPKMIKLIIDNLINNALKFTPAGGRVDVGAALRDDEIWIYVRDTGIGIPDDQKKRIFDRFYQVERHMRRHHEGMGLGLSIVKELVDRHRGRVWVESTSGKGSEFFVVLPQTI